MQTNKTIGRDTTLSRKARKLLDAAFEYWQEYQKECGSAAVVWLEADDGHFVLFTRGEYKRDFMGVIPLFTSDPPMNHPFGNGDMTK